MTLCPWIKATWIALMGLLVLAMITGGETAAIISILGLVMMQLYGDIVERIESLRGDKDHD